MSTFASFVFILNVSCAATGYSLLRIELRKEAAKISKFKVNMLVFIFVSNSAVAMIPVTGMIISILS